MSFRSAILTGASLCICAAFMVALSLAYLVRDVDSDELR